MTKAVQTKNNLCDCYGLVKGFLYTDSTGKMKYNPKLDVNTGGAYGRAVEKGSLSSLPELQGVILYMSGHVGVYIGNGEFIECAGGGKGMVKGKIEHGKVTKGSKFTHWFKDISITYVDKADIQQDKAVTEEVAKESSEENNGLVSMIVGNKTEYVKGFVVEDYNYVNLREIAEILGYAVEYDPFMKVPILGEKIKKIDDEYLKEVAEKL